MITRLKSGLYLEDKEILIPWLTSIKDLRDYAEPKIIAEDKKPSGLIYKTPYQYFIWENHIWSGLLCNIQTQLYHEAKTPTAWDHSNLFQHCYINILGESFKSDVQGEYDYLVSHFTNLYAQATEAGYNKDSYCDYPYHFWELDGKVRLSIVMQERFVEFNTIMIKYLYD